MPRRTVPYPWSARFANVLTETIRGHTHPPSREPHAAPGAPHPGCIGRPCSELALLVAIGGGVFALLVYLVRVKARLPSSTTASLNEATGARWATGWWPLRAARRGSRRRA